MLYSNIVPDNLKPDNTLSGVSGIFSPKWSIWPGQALPVRLSCLTHLLANIATRGAGGSLGTPPPAKWRRRAYSYLDSLRPNYNKEAAKRLGLVDYAISPRLEYKNCGFIECSEHYIRLKPVEKLDGRRFSQMERGVIRGMSERSASRFRSALLEYQFSKYCASRKKARYSSGFFLTLTYPENTGITVEKSKRDLDVFNKRLLRVFPSAGIIWRLEFQKNGTPHFHLILMLKGAVKFDIKTLRELVGSAWAEVCALGSESHFSAGTSVVTMYDGKGKLLNYISSYMCKSDQNRHDIETGRCWGFINCADLLTVARTRLYMDSVDYVRLLRRLRRWRGLRCSADRFSNYTMYGVPWSDLMRGLSSERLDIFPLIFSLGTAEIC